MVYKKHAIMNPNSLVSETQGFLGLAGKTDESIDELQDPGWRGLVSEKKCREQLRKILMLSYAVYTCMYTCHINIHS